MLVEHRDLGGSVVDAIVVIQRLYLTSRSSSASFTIINAFYLGRSADG